MLRGLNALEELLGQVLAGLGYELADFVFSSKNKVLQVFIDKLNGESGDPNGGITLDDCQRASAQLQRVLPVEGVSYERLEVSSPGLDRRLRKESDFARFVGNEVEIRLRVPVNGRRRLVGNLCELVDGHVLVDVAGVRQSVEFVNIERAHLVPKF